MWERMDRRAALIVSLVLIAIIGMSGVGAAHTGPPFKRVDAVDLTTSITILDNPSTSGDRLGAQDDEREEEDGEEDEKEEDSEEEERAALLGDWWGLGGEADETPYIGLVEIGVVVLGVGLSGYTLGKRTSLLPSQYRLYLLPAHEWTMLIGTALAAPHFLAVEEWEGLGFVVGVLLGIEVISGLYGRHLHRHVVRLGRGAETAQVLGRLIETSKESLFSRWRQIHITLTIVTGFVLVLHIVTALGD